MKDIRFPTLGFIEKKLSKIELDPIWEEVNKIKRDPTHSRPYNNDLVGHIKKEYEIKDCRDHLEKIVLECIIEYHKKFSYPGNLEMVNGPHKLSLTYVWANFMKKGEFNPIHGHNGVMSFVLWLQVPYYIEDEIEMYPEISPDKAAGGKFAFHYTDTIGTVSTFFLPADKRFEGFLVVFPSQLRHSVFPFFSSDEERISIAGNFLFEPVQSS